MGGNLWKVSERFELRLPLGFVMYILPGFVTDGGSVPRPLWSLIGHPLEQPTLTAYIIHDALYAAQYVSRFYSDLFFLILLKKLKLPRWRCYAIYLGVALFGGRAFRGKTVEGIEATRKLIKITHPKKS